MAIATEGTTERPACDRIGELRIKGPTDSAAGAIGTKLIRIGRSAIIIGRIGRVKPSGKERRKLHRPIHEEISVAAEHAGRRHHFRMSNGCREGRQDRIHRRRIRKISGIVRHGRRRVFVEENRVWIVHSVHDCREFERLEIAIGVDETTPAKRSKVGRILQWTGIQSQAEVKMRGVRCDVQHRIRRITHNVTCTRRITFDVRHGLPTISRNNPTRVWRGKRKRCGCSSNIATSKHSRAQTSQGQKTKCPVSTTPSRK